MWLERVMIIPTSTAHDFMPHNWSSYFPNIVERSITIASFCFFSLLFLVFSKTLPTIPIADYKKRVGEKDLKKVSGLGEAPIPQETKISSQLPAVTAFYTGPAALIEAVKKTVESGFRRIEFFSPMRLEELEKFLGHRKSPVRFWTLAGALSGLIGGFALAILTAGANGLIVGGKHPVSLIPYCIPGFEGLILLGSIGNLIGLFVHTRFYFREILPYDRRYSLNRFGLVANAELGQFDELKDVIARTRPAEVRYDE
jgi:molybdopterin-containing oxidoreductase family membrane subunit